MHLHHYCICLRSDHFQTKTCLIAAVAHSHNMQIKRRKFSCPRPRKWRSCMTNEDLLLHLFIAKATLQKVQHTHVPFWLRSTPDVGAGALYML